MPAFGKRRRSGIADFLSGKRVVCLYRFVRGKARWFWILSGPDAAL